MTRKRQTPTIQNTTERVCSYCSSPFRAFKWQRQTVCSASCRGKRAMQVRWGNEDARVNQLIEASRREPDQCWPWAGRMHYRGYGSVWLGGPKRAHRVVYARLVGPIPDEMHILHSCDNPACVNPAHLAVGSHQDNMTDRNLKGRQARGERHARAKLTEADVSLLKRDLIASVSNTLQLSKAYGISYSTCRAIRDGDHWGWVKPAG